MFSDESQMMPSFTSGGSVFCSPGSLASTCLAMLTELAPDCFCMMIVPPRTPLV